MNLKSGESFRGDRYNVDPPSKQSPTTFLKVTALDAEQVITMAIQKDPFNSYKFPALNKITNSGVKAGTSLLTPPGQMPFERRKVFTSDVAFIEDDVVPNLKNPERLESLVEMIALGLSPQAISYMYVTDAMSRGLINPDVAEVSRPQIEAILLQQVLSVDPNISINLPKEPKKHSQYF